MRAWQKRWQWFRYRRRLESIATLDEFQALLGEIPNPIFELYEAWDPVARKDIAAALDALAVDLRGKSFLDVGPGYGSALDIAHERGAAAIEFVDYDPFVCAFNRLKGYTGWRVDVRRELSSIAPRKYDFIWLKGTFTADRFMDGVLRSYQYPKLESVLSDVDRLLAPGGRAVFCPHWDSPGGHRRNKRVLETSVAEILQKNEYSTIPWIPDHNVEPMYPVTFIRQKSA